MDAWRFDCSWISLREIFQDWRRCRYCSLTNPLMESVKITVYSDGEIG